MNLWEILSAILMIFGLILNGGAALQIFDLNRGGQPHRADLESLRDSNLSLAISVVRNVGNIQKRLDELEEMNNIWRDSIQSRVQSLETWRRKCALARRSQINNGGTQQ